ncbi:uncharacterized protein BDZ83DRAFT_649429 [Colletotrichum acutatum]|uniref:Uncharacterized protein n=1 Tax=Glomerella acutata TaxID=27357 RepID=A0AAD8UWF6_GLOAC|nr:uncharacterized protein BDZ83DRAFT_649429 [Colletotrichum acutatum]KAK1727555.1 hypothetical protein BDZ83DRAFT_649429 [Colletotrichum acutatum]
MGTAAALELSCATLVLKLGFDLSVYPQLIAPSPIRGLNAICRWLKVLWARGTALTREGYMAVGQYMGSKSAAPEIAPLRAVSTTVDISRMTSGTCVEEISNPRATVGQRGFSGLDCIPKIDELLHFTVR